MCRNTCRRKSKPADLTTVGYRTKFHYAHKMDDEDFDENEYHVPVT